MSAVRNLSMNVSVTPLPRGRQRVKVTLSGLQGGKYGSLIVGYADGALEGDPSDLEELVSMALSALADMVYCR